MSASMAQALWLSRAVLRPLFCLGAAAVSLGAHADSTALTIVDDSTMNSQVAQARADFLATRPSLNFTRCNLTVLVRQTDGSWKRGSYGQETLSYPASTVKLNYLAAAMYWTRINGQAYTSMDAKVRPMIRWSSNPDTGLVVDQISGAPNISDVNSMSDSRYTPWYNKRLFPENYLSGRGLLENMTSLQKTYPANNAFNGAEVVCIQQHRGGNRLKPKLMASTMAEIARGLIEPGATTYMRSLLGHDRFGAYGPLGWGLPPGSTYETKYGNAYEDLNDVSYIVLPNGKEMVVSVYSNGWVDEDTWPSPLTVSGLGPLMENLIERLGLASGNPAKIKVDNNATNVTYNGTWSTGTGARDKVGTNYRFKSGGTGTSKVTWPLNAPSTGRYEVCVWFPQGTNRTSAATYTVNHAGGATPVAVNQKIGGGRWIRLGDFQINSGSGSVVLSDSIPEGTGAVVMADGVKATLWPADIIVDNASTGFTASANWSTGTSAADKYGSNYRFRSTQAITDPATFTYTAPRAGYYEIYGWWSQGTNRSSTAPYVLTSMTGNTTVNRNQQTGGGSWQSLGTHYLNNGTNNVKLSCWTGAGFVIMADAIRVSRR